MEVEFQIGRGLAFGFEVGGGSPAPVPPQPTTASAVYGDVSVILGATGAFGTDAVYGEATREEET